MYKCILLELYVYMTDAYKTDMIQWPIYLSICLSIYMRQWQIRSNDLSIYLCIQLSVWEIDRSDPRASRSIVLFLYPIYMLIHLYADHHPSLHWPHHLISWLKNGRWVNVCVSVYVRVCVGVCVCVGVGVCVCVCACLCVSLHVCVYIYI